LTKAHEAVRCHNRGADKSRFPRITAILVISRNLHITARWAHPLGRRELPPVSGRKHQAVVLTPSLVDLELSGPSNDPPSSDPPSSSPLRRAVARQQGIDVADVHVLRGEASSAGVGAIVVGVGESVSAIRKRARTRDDEYANLTKLVVCLHPSSASLHQLIPRPLECHGRPYG